MVPAGWATRRSAATEGLSLVTHPIVDLRVLHAQVLQDRVAAGTSGRRQRDGLGELLGAQPDVGGDDRQLVPAQAVDDLLDASLVLSQEEAEGGTDPGELAVVGGAGKELIHGMKD